MSKVCSKCKIEKLKEEFNRHSCSPDGLQYSCKQCRSLEKKTYKKENSEKIKEIDKIYYENNKEKISLYAKNRYEKDKIRINEISKSYRERTKDQRKAYYLQNKEKFNDRNKKYKEEFKQIHGVCYDTYYKRINPLFKLAKNLRRRLNKTLKVKFWTKHNTFSEYLGCPREFLITYLESKFQEGMTWDNYGYGEKFWNVDHRIPLSSANSEEELYKLCHYTNLQPMWQPENLSKQDKIIY